MDNNDGCLRACCGTVLVHRRCLDRDNGRTDIGAVRIDGLPSKAAAKAVLFVTIRRQTS